MTPLEQNIEDLKVLWPYLSFWQRFEWIERLEPLFENDFVKTLAAVMGPDERIKNAR